MQHDPRGKTHEARTTVGFIEDGPFNTQLRVAQQQQVAHRQVQAVQQRRIHPNHARLGPPCHDRLQALRVAHRQAAAQGVGASHRLHGHQAKLAALLLRRAGHAGKAHSACDSQTLLGGRLGPCRRQGLITRHRKVATQELARITGQASLQPVGEKAHSRQGGHR